MWFRSILRTIAYGLLFWFIYRVLVGAFRFLAQDSRKEREPHAERRAPDPPKEQPTYRDVKDAEFKDLPDDPSKSS